MTTEVPECTGNFFYLKADEDHYDLEDLFQGEYDKKRREWKFPESVRDSLTQFLNCSSSETECTTDEESTDSPKPKRTRDRLHRANSFNASDDSDEDDLDSLDENYRRHRPSKRKLAKELSTIRKSIQKII
jgi:hypothetical protein